MWRLRRMRKRQQPPLTSLDQRRRSATTAATAAAAAAALTAAAAQASPAACSPAVGVGAVAMLMSKDIKQSSAMLRRNMRHIRTWLEEQGAAAECVALGLRLAAAVRHPRDALPLPVLLPCISCSCCTQPATPPSPPVAPPAGGRRSRRSSRSRRPSQNRSRPRRMRPSSRPHPLQPQFSHPNERIL